MSKYLAILLLLPLQAFAASAEYQEGDIIFHESQSAQSKGIQEATGSRWSHVGIIFKDNGQWVVAEAVQPVRVVSLSSWKARGKNGDYRVVRLPGLTDVQKKELRYQVSAILGKDYDLYFEWSDEKIYCSELVYKTYLKATGIEIGSVQKFRDLRLDGPYIRELIKRRTQDGHQLDVNEAIMTPASQAIDPKLQVIEE